MLDLAQHLPQRVFLLQGDQGMQESLIKSLEASYPLVHALSVPRFTVDHAATVAEFAIEGDGSERVFVIYFAVFSPDAAQILLKSLEEPAPQTTIIFVTPYPYVVPLTIRSRAVLIQETRSIEKPPARTKAALADYVKKEFGSDSDDDAATRRASAVALLDSMELQYKSDAAKARTIYEAKRMLFKANLPTKFVMEYVVAAVG